MNVVRSSWCLRFLPNKQVLCESGSSTTFGGKTMAINSGRFLFPAKLHFFQLISPSFTLFLALSVCSILAGERAIGEQSQQELEWSVRRQLSPAPSAPAQYRCWSTLLLLFLPTIFLYLRERSEASFSLCERAEARLGNVVV